MMNIAFPLTVDDHGRTASSSDSAHIRDLIEQVLLVRPGERLLRPTFGCNLLGLVFEAGGPGLGAAAQQMVMGALDQWLGQLIEVREVEVQNEDSTLTVRVSYMVRATEQEQVSQFTQRL
jgi:phage baseplate assembly protein W